MRGDGIDIGGDKAGHAGAIASARQRRGAAVRIRASNTSGARKCLIWPLLVIFVSAAAAIAAESVTSSWIMSTPIVTAQHLACLGEMVLKQIGDHDQTPRARNAWPCRSRCRSPRQR